ncbi:MAG: glycosyltransferase family 9 protein [Bacteroidetes bacterium]|nr:glycosyltransferase family 9 protein [Bacteroidota bacterium]
MKIETIRWVDRNPGRIICFLLTVWRTLFKPFFGRPKKPVQKILFIKFIEQGATVIAYSAIKKAVDKVGRENVYFCVFSQNRPILDLINLLPKENVIEINDSSLGAFFKGAITAIFKIKRLKIDAAVDMEFFSRASAIFGYLSGAKRRVGLHRFTSEYSYRGRLLTHEVQHNAYLHASVAYLLLVEKLFVDASTIPAPKVEVKNLPTQVPVYSPDEAKVSAFKQKLQAELGGQMPEKLILLNPNTSDMLPLRQWETEKFVELAKRIIEAFPNAQMALTGAPNEAPKLQGIAQQFSANKVVSLASKTTLEELLILYQLSDLLVTNDSGPAHFASMCDIDVLVLFGPETPQLFGPLGERIHVVWKALSCSPCINAINHRFSPCTDNQCMKQITVDEVYGRVKIIMDSQ